MRQIHVGTIRWRAGFFPDCIPTFTISSPPWLFWSPPPCFSLCMCHPPMRVSVSNILLNFVGSQIFDKWSQSTYILRWSASFVLYMSMRSIYADGCKCSLLIFTTTLNSCVEIYFWLTFFCLTFRLFCGFSVLFCSPIAIKNNATRKILFLFLSLNIFKDMHSFFSTKQANKYSLVLVNWH